MNDPYAYDGGAYDGDAFSEDPFDDFEGLRFFVPRTATQVVGDTVEFVRENIVGLVSTAAGFVGPVLGASLLAGLAAIWLLVGEVSTGLGIVLAVLAFIGLMVVMLLYNTSCFAYLRLYHEEGPGGVAPDLLRAEVRELFWPLFGLSVLIALLGGVAQIVTIIPFLGILIYFMAYLFFLPVLALPPAIFTLRGAELVESIGRAYELVKPRWARAFGAILLLYLLLMVAVFVAIFIPGLISGFVVAALGLDGTMAVLTFAPMAVAILALSLVGMFVWSTGCTLLYGALAEQAEGVSLSARVDALDDLDAPNAPPAW